MKQKLVLTLFFIFVTVIVFAKVQLPHVLSDNLVLQQKTEVNLWGTADLNAKIIVRTTWNNEKYTTQSDQNGKWKLSLPTAKAGGPFEISISDGEEVVLKNILLGEVWLCSGQSNMEMPLKGFRGQPVEMSNEVIARAKKRQPIRMFTAANISSKNLQDDVEGEWLENSPEAVSKFSATAYFFAQYLQNVLEVPVGIIISSWGGTRIEAWMGKQSLEAPEFKGSIQKRRGFNGESNLYNGKLYPLSNYSIKGFLWYQGESNVNNAVMYQKLFPAFVKDLRRTWNQGDFPFYYVQIAPYEYDDPNGTQSARLRESQLRSLEHIPNAGMVVTMDIGEEYCIHPADKEKVAHRLAYWALNKTYGIDCIGYRAPEYKSIEIQEDKAYVLFELFSSNCIGPMEVDILDNFEIAGEDKVFYPAVARIDQRLCNKISVYSEKVPNPVAVRYGYKNYVKGVLYDNTGLPVSSFRTDNW